MTRMHTTLFVFVAVTAVLLVGTAISPVAAMERGSSYSTGHAPAVDGRKEPRPWFQRWFRPSKKQSSTADADHQARSPTANKKTTWSEWWRSFHFFKKKSSRADAGQQTRPQAAKEEAAGNPYTNKQKTTQSQRGFKNPIVEKSSGAAGEATLTEKPDSVYVERKRVSQVYKGFNTQFDSFKRQAENGRLDYEKVVKDFHADADQPLPYTAYIRTLDDMLVDSKRMLGDLDRLVKNITNNPDMKDKRTKQEMTLGCHTLKKEVERLIGEIEIFHTTLKNAPLLKLLDI